MKKIHTYIALLSLLFITAACEKEGETLVVSGFGPAQLISTQENIMLNDKNSQAIVLSLAWQNASLTLNSNIGEMPASMITNTLQVANESNFITSNETNVEALSIAYTGTELNKLAQKLGLEIDIEAPLYFRLKSSIGANRDVAYSNMIKVNITPYKPSSGSDDDNDPAYLYMPKKEGGFTDFSNRLYTKANDGIYTGFIEAAEWENFRFYSSRNTETAEIYGSAPNELYKLDISNDKWNIWFDKGGYFYVTANLNAMTWGKTPVTSITATGDFNGWSDSATPLTYSSETKQWTTVCDINNIGFGLKFLINKDWAFSLTDIDGEGELTLASEPNIVPESTGTYKITIDISNPKRYTYILEKQ